MSPYPLELLVAHRRGEPSVARGLRRRRSGSATSWTGSAVRSATATSIGDTTLADYQSIFGTTPGSAEMPSAGRPFTPEVVTRLVSQGVGIAPVLLHTGVSSQEAGEAPQPEWFEVGEATARQVNSTRAGGGRIVAVGTTVTRALESAATVRPGVIAARSGWTERVVTREHPPLDRRRLDHRVARSAGISPPAGGVDRGGGAGPSGIRRSGPARLSLARVRRLRAVPPHRGGVGRIGRVSGCGALGGRRCPGGCATMRA